MPRTHVALIALWFFGACHEGTQGTAEECEVDGDPCGVLGECRDGICVEIGFYRDCMNSQARCGGVGPMCFSTDDAFYGACSWSCSSQEECWDAPAGFVSDCIELLNDDQRCFVMCGDEEACPAGMGCIQGVCLYEADGCGQTASPSAPGQCSCDAGLQWCSSDPNDESNPNRLDCCPIPSGDNGGGGGGGDNGGEEEGGGCCRMCDGGKPCGDSCIASNLQCNQPPGCAC